MVSRSFVGLVIANEGENFSAGANLMEVLGAARAAQWDAIEAAVRNFQNVNMRLRYSDKPVVVAPHNMTLGGACEMAVHADLIHASPELYMGFVETGVGLIPAAGGCKEMVLRAADNAAILAAQILALSDTALAQRLKEFKEKMAAAVIEKDKKLQSEVNEI
jgi:3-hydroxyacyl-CoA dehydrogenase